MPETSTSSTDGGELVRSESLMQRLPAETVRVSMSRVVLAWGFGAAYFNLTSGAIYTAFAREIGANNTVFGILAAALPLMSFLQVLSAYMVERTRRRKRQMLIAGVLGRSLWLIAPLLPLLSMQFPSVVPRSIVLPFVILTIMMSSVCQAFSSPAFFSWMTDLVPARVRPAFFAARVQVGTLVALFASIFGGLVADNFPDLRVYCIILALAAVAGIIDNLVFLGVREPRPVEVDDALDDLARNLPSPWASIREPLLDPAIRRFLGFVALLTCGYGFYGPFLWLHSLEYLNLSKTETGLMLNAAPMSAIALTSRFWGGITQRYGNRPVMRLCSAGLTMIPIGMIVIQPDPDLFSKALLTILLFLSGILFVAIDLSNVNLLTGLAPHIPRSTMTAIFSIAAGTSFAISSVAAGWIADILKSFHWQIGALDFVNYHVLFACSLLVRAINAIWVAPRLQEPEARGTRETVREVVPQLMQGISLRITRPFVSREN